MKTNGWILAIGIALAGCDAQPEAKLELARASTNPAMVDTSSGIPGVTLADLEAFVKMQQDRYGAAAAELAAIEADTQAALDAGTFDDLGQPSGIESLARLYLIGIKVSARDTQAASSNGIGAVIGATLDWIGELERAK
jgi:hypothetical protein